LECVRQLALLAEPYIPKLHLKFRGELIEVAIDVLL
jgi:hypothetical protein